MHHQKHVPGKNLVEIRLGIDRMLVDPEDSLVLNVVYNIDGVVAVLSVPTNCTHYLESVVTLVRRARFV